MNDDHSRDVLVCDSEMYLYVGIYVTNVNIGR